MARLAPLPSRSCPPLLLSFSFLSSLFLTLLSPAQGLGGTWFFSPYPLSSSSSSSSSASSLGKSADLPALSNTVVLRGNNSLPCALFSFDAITLDGYTLSLSSTNATGTCGSDLTLSFQDVKEIGVPLYLRNITLTLFLSPTPFHATNVTALLVSYRTLFPAHICFPTNSSANMLAARGKCFDCAADLAYVSAPCNGTKISSLLSASSSASSSSFPPASTTASSFASTSLVPTPPPTQHVVVLSSPRLQAHLPHKQVAGLQYSPADPSAPCPQPPSQGFDAALYFGIGIGVLAGAGVVLWGAHLARRSLCGGGSKGGYEPLPSSNTGVQAGDM